VPGWRLLWLELRHNPMLWMTPLLVALFFFDPYRTAMGYAPIWDLRASVILNKMLPDFVAFTAGVAAWAGTRDSRRRTIDLVTATPRPRWVAHILSWAATTCWTVLIYLGFVTVLYVVTAGQATWGGPPWWPVAVGAVALAALCAFGFAAGVLFPSRFTAPLAALAAFLLTLIAFQEANSQSNIFALLSPATSVPSFDVGVFYPYLPDLAITQVIFLGGATAVALGIIGLSAAADAGPRLRRAAAIVSIAGLAAAGTAVALTGTAQRGPYGVVIPALHDAASDRPIPYSPVCTQAAVPICVHPAFHAYLHDVVTALDPVLAEVAGLPGAPARVQQTAINGMTASDGAAISGDPAVFALPMPPVPGQYSFGATTSTFITQVRLLFVTGFVGGSRGFVEQADSPPAQLAVEAALLQEAGAQAPIPPDPAAGAAAHRFAALSAPARHAWLAAHLPALRAGQISLAQLP
jgi:hypothetical protein